MKRIETILYILVNRILPFGFFSGLIYLMIFCLNGCNQTVDTNVAENIFTGLLAILSMVSILLYARMMGEGIINLGGGAKAIAEVNGTVIYKHGENNYSTGKRGMQGNGMFIVYMLICIVVTPFYLLLGLVGIIVSLISPELGAWFGGSPIDDKYKSGMLFGLISLGIMIIPLIVHSSRAIKYSCNKFSFELEKIEYVESKNSYGVIYLNVDHSSNSISSLNISVNIYYEDELIEQSFFKEKYNHSTDGLCSVKKGENDDFQGGIIKLSCSKDIYNLYVKRSDKLKIEVVINETSFNKDLIEASSLYLDKIDSYIIYSYPDYINEHDYTKENKEKYDNAIKLYNENNYEEALKIFNEISFYEKSKEYISLCQNGLIENVYQNALDLFNSKNYEEAKLLFSEIIDYKDSKEYIEKCDSSNIELKYLNAINKFNNSNYDIAYIEFKELDSYKESNIYINKIKEIITNEATKIVLEGKYQEALDLLYNFDLKKDNSTLCNALEESTNGYYKTLVNLLNLEKVTVMEGLTIIEPYSFLDCKNVKEIKLPSSLEIIEYEAFKNCTGLENLYIPESVVYIGEKALSGCVNLESVNIPINVNDVGDGILYNCNSLKKITLGLNNNFTVAGLFNTYPIYTDKVPSTLSEIEVIKGNVIPEKFFFKLPSTVSNIIFNEEIIEVKEYGFSESKFIPIFPKGLKIIGSYAYSNMKYGDVLTIPEGVEVIKDKAFSATLYHTVNLPSTLKELGASCFENMHGDDNKKTKVINFNGTKDKFLSIANDKWSLSLGSSFSTYELYCTDAKMTFVNGKKEWHNL